MKTTIGKVLRQKPEGRSRRGRRNSLCRPCAPRPSRRRSAPVTSPALPALSPSAAPARCSGCEVSALLGMCNQVRRGHPGHPRIREAQRQGRLGRRPHVLHQERPRQEVGHGWARCVRCAGRHACGLRHRQHVPDELHSLPLSLPLLPPLLTATVGNGKAAIALIAGIIVASVCCAGACMGGLKRVGEVTEKLVPVMAVIYIVSSLVLIFFAHIGNFGESASVGIVVGAFNPSADSGRRAGHRRHPRP